MDFTREVTGHSRFGGKPILWGIKDLAWVWAKRRFLTYSKIFLEK
jgi:hypothetical protein